MEIINIEQLEKLPEMLFKLNNARIKAVEEALKIRDRNLQIYKEQIEDLQEKIRYIEAIPLESLDTCPICGKLYDRRNGKTCSMSCLVEKYS